MAFFMYSGLAMAATTRGYASIIVHAETGAVISEANADTLLYPASLTKMMTAYLLFDAIERGQLSMRDTIAISSHAARQSPTKIGLQAGERISVEDAVQAIITRSANDIAAAVAEQLAGNETSFAQRMTTKARAIGMSRTTFRNASGLPHSGQVSTARDMATLARRLMLDFPQYYHYFGADEAVVAGRKVRGHNRLLDSYRGMDGLKTGYINASGFNLVSSASRGGVRLIGVVFGGKTAKSRDLHMAELFDIAFRKYGVMSAPADTRGLIVFLKSTKAQSAPHKHADKDSELDKLVSKHSAANSADLAPAPSASATPPPVTITTAMVTPPVITIEPLAKNWAIQVGAYRDEVSALQAATDTIRLAKIEGGQAKVDPAQTPAGLLYRAQVGGLDQKQAGAVCEALAVLSRNCLMIAP